MTELTFACPYCHEPEVEIYFSRVPSGVYVCRNCYVVHKPLEYFLGQESRREAEWTFPAPTTLAQLAVSDIGKCSWRLTDNEAPFLVLCLLDRDSAGTARHIMLEAWELALPNELSFIFDAECDRWRTSLPVGHAHGLLCRIIKSGPFHRTIDHRFII